jgi:hypothetical protein
MQNNQYPKTYTIATDILSNHRFDNRGNSKKKKWNNIPKKDEDKNSSSKTTNGTNMQHVLRKAAKTKHVTAAERQDT